VLVVLALVLTACSQKPAGTPAPLFELTNQYGQVTSLADLQGKVVVLTFLYTHCPDTCPLYLSKISQAMMGLEGNSEDSVAVVAVTVDPERDTVERLKDYMAYLPSDWQFLTGTPGQLKTMWEEYGIFVEKQAAEGGRQGHTGYQVTHTAKVVIIDGKGFQRAELRGDWRVSGLAEKVNALLAGQPVSGSNLGESVTKLLHRCGSFVFSSIGGALLFYFAMVFLPVAALGSVGFLLLTR
jgi:protein SCO1/2